ncbi:MAG: PfkB family carbohydrate kinase, partial [Pseudomonadota bacterium]
MDAAPLGSSALGANDALSIPHIEQQADAIGVAKIVVSQLESHLPATARAFELARECGVTTLLNPAPINPGVSKALLSLVDIVTPNETEFAFLCQHLLEVTLPERYWTGDPETLHNHCRALGVDTVIVTLGEDGCFVSLSDAAAAITSTPVYFSVGPAEVTPVDTTGAGDAFNGGLASALSRVGMAQFKAALVEANQVAGLSIEKPGTAPAMPTKAEREQRFGAAPE